MPKEIKANKKRCNTRRANHHTSLHNAHQKIDELEESLSQQKKINEILQETVRHYQTISEILHDLIFIVDNEGFVQYVNSAAADLLKSKAGNIIGKPLKTLFPAESFEIQKRNLDNVFNEKSPFYTEDKIIFPGAEIWLDTHLIPIKDKEGNVSSVLGIARNTTERKNLGSDIKFTKDRPSDSSLNPNTDNLTKRENEILRLIASGMTNKQIAEDLCISAKTVDTHRTRIMKKIKAHNTACLVRFAINKGLL